LAAKPTKQSSVRLHTRAICAVRPFNVPVTVNVAVSVAVTVGVTVSCLRTCLNTPVRGSIPRQPLRSVPFHPLPVTCQLSWTKFTDSMPSHECTACPHRHPRVELGSLKIGSLHCSQINAYVASWHDTVLSAWVTAIRGRMVRALWRLTSNLQPAHCVTKRGMLCCAVLCRAVLRHAVLLAQVTARRDMARSGPSFAASACPRV
jgi:Zn finger protein HypA/HybF involved in hydrogenase expression